MSPEHPRGPRLSACSPDPDPLPRPAGVQASSVYAGLATAVSVEARELAPAAPRALEAPRSTPVRSWWLFPADPPGGPGAPPGSDAVRAGWRAVAAPHSFARMEPDLADATGPVWYARALPAAGVGRRLVFPMLDYVAQLYRNGELVGAHEGGCAPVALDLPAGRAHVVAVRVDDPVEAGLLSPQPLVAAKRKIKGVLEFHDSRPGGAIQGAYWPAAAARRWRTGGLGAVPLAQPHGPVRLDATFVRAEPGRIWCNWVLTNTTPEPLVIQLHAQVALARTPTGEPGSGEAAAFSLTSTLPPGGARLAVTARLDGVRAWRTGSGQTTLYVLASQVRCAGRVSGASEVRFGVRSATVSLDGATPFQLRIDGVPRYLQAANYIPGLWPGELDEATLRTDVALAQAAHLDSLAPHAHVPVEAFFDIADEQGLVVYQDFPLNLAYDPAGAPLYDGGPTMGQASLLLAAEVAYRLFNHPCVVYYAGHNEPAYTLAELFGNATHPDLARVGADLLGAPDEEPLDARRAELFARVDPTRAVLAASGTRRRPVLGDAHSYSGSLNGDATTEVTRLAANFVSEFGAWTPNFSAAADVAAARGDWPPPPGYPADWEHQTHILAPQEAHAGRPERYPDFPTWAFAAQLWAGTYIKLGVESFRRRRGATGGATVCHGHRYHFFVDHYGGAGAGVLDRHRTRQLTYFALAAAGAPLLPVVEATPGMRALPGRPLALGTWVLDDRPEASPAEVGRRPARLDWQLRRLTGEQAWVIGSDEPAARAHFGELHRIPGELVVVPHGPGTLVTGGGVDLELTGAVTPGPRLELELPDADEPVAYLLALELRLSGATVRNWGAVLAAPATYDPAPGLAPAGYVPGAGLAPAPRFDLAVSAAGVHRLQRRWTGECVRTGRGRVHWTDLPPDQYLLVGERTLAVDLYGDVAVDLGTGRAVALGELPWAFTPGGEL